MDRRLTMKQVAEAVINPEAVPESWPGKFGVKRYINETQYGLFMLNRAC
jgi:hypothetical protein